MAFTRADLEKIHRKYSRPEFIHPDPLEFLFEYESPADREVVGLIASCLAYGRVAQILASVRRVLDVMGPPHAFVARSSKTTFEKRMTGFKHRFTTHLEMTALLWGMKKAIEGHGSLGALFEACLEPGDRTVVPALGRFVDVLQVPSKGACGSLLPHPSKGSACKRLNLYLRWMVRRDAVDPGGWDHISPSLLVIPLDTHMHKVALAHGLTARKNPDLRCAMEITEGFARFSPDDPVKYDFALTRPGIRGE